MIPGNEKNRCFVCGAYCSTHKHHIFGGANRKHSEKYGLYVYLCPEDHNMSDRGVHFNKALMDELHKIGQEAFERDTGLPEKEARREFMRVFGRNYL